jgi:hypothetical protein
MAVNPGQHDFTLQRRSDWSISVQVLIDDVPLNMGGWTVEAQVWNEDRSTKYADMAVAYTNRSTGTFTLSLTDEQTEWFPGVAYYDVLLINSGGLREYYLEGTITVSEGYTA